MKKSERHLIKRDELMTVFERSTLYVEEHTRTVALVAGGVVLLVIGGLAVRSWMATSEEEASSPRTRRHSTMNGA